ncbi:MAG: hypothetical protein AABY22_03290 [Nanoarchaeota archaeon]
MKIKKKGNYLEINGKLYRVTESKGKINFEDMEFEPVSKDIEKMIRAIAKKIKGAVNPEEIIENALYDLSEEQIEKIHKKLTVQRTKPKMKKRYGCFELNVGGISIPIRN